MGPRGRPSASDPERMERSRLGALGLSNPEPEDHKRRLPRHTWLKGWQTVEEPVVPLERDLCAHPFAGLRWERQFEKVVPQSGCEKAPSWECLSVHRQQGVFLIRVRGRDEDGREEAEFGAYVEEIDDTS